MCTTDELSPNTRYGKIENNTELIVTPYKDGTSNDNKTTTKSQSQLNGSEEAPKSAEQINGSEEPPKSQPYTNGRVELPNGHSHSNGEAETPEKRGTLYDRLFNKNAKTTEPMEKPKPTRQFGSGASIIDSTTLDNVTVKSSSTDDGSSDSDVSNYDGNAQSFSSSSKPKPASKRSTSKRTSTKSTPPPPKSKPIRLDVQSRLFDALFTELKNQDRQSYQFRAIPHKWTDAQMSDLFLTQHNRPAALDTNQIYVLNCETINEHDERTTKEYYVNVRMRDESEHIPKNIFPSIEITDALMAHMKMKKYSRITLNTKKTVLNFVEKIELIPSSKCTLSLRNIEDTFKRLLIRCSHTLPMLMNQEQVFRIGDNDGDVVMAKIYPESFRYCLCDGEILRENKIFVVEQRRDLSGLFANAEELGSGDVKSDSGDTGGFSANECIIQLDEFDEIVDSCVENIVVNGCLDERNQLRKVNNHLIIGDFRTHLLTFVAINFHNFRNFHDYLQGNFPILILFFIFVCHFRWFNDRQIDNLQRNSSAASETTVQLSRGNLPLRTKQITKGR